MDKCSENFVCDRRRESKDNSCNCEYFVNGGKVIARGKYTTAEQATDSRIKFRRPSDDTIYCVLAPATAARLRKANQLDAFLKKERDSGIVIRPIYK